MTYQDAVAFLYERLPMFQRLGAQAFKKDLSNTLKLCAYLGHPEHKFKSIHIAGTNGKGTTAHTLAAVFQSAAYKTGLYTSPHLKSFTERMRIDGQAIAEQEVVEFVSAHQAAILEIQPSFFELTVAMAFDFFARHQVDIAIIEVGMGGRLDSTNVITPELSVITRIGKDHQEFLGDTLEKIAVEKAGIIKPKVPVIISFRQEETEGVFRAKAKEVEAPLSFAQDKLNLQYITYSKEGINVEVSFTEQHEDLSGTYVFGLQGAYQEYNLPGILCALAQIRTLGFDLNKKHLEQGLKNVNALTGLRGRWQILGEDPLIVADTGHNEDAIKSNMQQISRTPHKRLHLILGFVRDKDMDAMFKLLPKDADYYFTQADIPRALSAVELQEYAKTQGINAPAFADVNMALVHARAVALAGDFIYIGGSTFVVAELNDL